MLDHIQNQIALRPTPPSYAAALNLVGEMKQVSQRYLERVMRAAMKAGVPFGGMEIRPDGTVALFSQPGGPMQTDALDEELANWRKSRGDH